MKKIFLSIISLLLATNIFAQETTSLPPKAEILKHEVGVSIGAIPAFMYIPMMAPNVNFNYYYNFNHRHSIGASLSLTASTYFFAEPSKDLYLALTPQINYKLNYLHQGKISLYGFLSFGVHIAHYKSMRYMPTFQVTPFGFSYGTKHCVAVEIGYGVQGIIICGYHYLFNSK